MPAEYSIDWSTSTAEWQRAQSVLARLTAEGNDVLALDEWILQGPLTFLRNGEPISGEPIPGCPPERERAVQTSPPVATFDVCHLEYWTHLGWSIFPFRDDVRGQPWSESYTVYDSGEVIRYHARDGEVCLLGTGPALRPWRFRIPEAAFFECLDQYVQSLQAAMDEWLPQLRSSAFYSRYFRP